MQVVPKDISFATAQMDGFNRNRFRLETNGATTAGPGSIISLTLPSNSIIDLKSFKVHLDVATTSDASSTNAIYAKLPADTASLIQQCEVYCGGVQICQGFQEYNSCSKIKKIVNASRDREGSVDGTLSHGLISTGDAVDSVSVVFKPNIGLFAESSTRMLPTSLTGDLSVRLTLASTAVLAYKEVTVDMAASFSDAAARASALLTTYSVSSIHATIDTVTLGDAYEKLLLDRLMQEDSLNVNFKEYYTFSLHGTSNTSHDVRFALSASSIDNLYTVCRDANYQTAGIVTRAYSGNVNSDGLCANYFQFKGFNNSSTARGSLRYHYTANNVRHPQYDADVLDAAHDLIMITDQHGDTGRGNLVSSLTDFQTGKCILPCVLNLPSQPVSVQCGLNSRGNNTQFSVSITGQTVPTAVDATQVTAAISTLVVVETTCQLRIGGSKQVAVSY